MVGARKAVVDSDHDAFGEGSPVAMQDLTQKMEGWIVRTEQAMKQLGNRQEASIQQLRQQLDNWTAQQDRRLSGSFTPTGSYEVDDLGIQSFAVDQHQSQREPERMFSFDSECLREAGNPDSGRPASVRGMRAFGIEEEIQKPTRRSKTPSVHSNETPILELGAVEELDPPPFAGRKSFFGGKKKEPKLQTLDEIEKDKRDMLLAASADDGKLKKGQSSPGVDSEEDGQKPRITFENFVKSVRFDNLSAIFLVSNAVFIGVQVEVAFHYPNAPLPIMLVDYAFCVVFLSELFLRIWAYGIKDFLTNKDRGWNWFDLIVVSLSTVDAVMSMAAEFAPPAKEGEEAEGPVENISIVRVIRIVRMTRVLRVIRAVRAFRPLRLLVVAIGSTLKTALWAVMLLSIVMYMFAIAIAQSVADSLNAMTPEELEHADVNLTHYFGSVPQAVFTLYMAILGGISWEIAVIPLADVGPHVFALFVICVAFLLLCVLNVLTGIFCESALETARNDRERVIEIQMQDKDKYVRELTELFSTWDLDGGNNITFEEFQDHLADEHMQALFKSLEIEGNDAWTLFKLLDTDGEGTVDLDEFISGCIHVRGGAKAVHLAQMQYENKWLMDKIVDVQQAVLDIKSKVLEEPADSKQVVKAKMTGPVGWKAPPPLEINDDPMAPVIAPTPKKKSQDVKVNPRKSSMVSTLSEKSMTERTLSPSIKAPGPAVTNVQRPSSGIGPSKMAFEESFPMTPTKRAPEDATIIEQIDLDSDFSGK